MDASAMVTNRYVKAQQKYTALAAGPQMSEIGFDRGLEELVVQLISTPDIDQWCDEDTARPSALFAGVDVLIESAFGDQQQAARDGVSRILLRLYEMTIAEPGAPELANQFHPVLLEIRRRLERAWLTDLARQQQSAAVNVAGLPVSTRLRSMWETHPVRDHSLFDFLATEATRTQIAEMLKRDWALNIRFYDILVMSMVGAPHEARQELSKNFWDEMGRGEIESNHVMLFKKILASIPITPEDGPTELILGREGVEGYNLFMLCAVNRIHYFKLLGVMAITELLDPSNYEKLLIGCRRVGFPEDVLAYYGEHATIDIEHADGWLHNVIEPLLVRLPAAGDDIISGASLRLDTCQRYYDALLMHLKTIES